MKKIKTSVPFGHDHNMPPVGYLDTDGKIKLCPSSGITPEQLCNLEIGYTPHKIVNGEIVEAELTELSLVVKK